MLCFFIFLGGKREKKIKLTSLLSVGSPSVRQTGGIFNDSHEEEHVATNTHAMDNQNKRRKKTHRQRRYILSRNSIYIYIHYIYIYSHTRTHTHIQPTYVIICQFVSRSAFRSRSKQSRFLCEKKSSIEESICHDTNLCFYGAQAA